MQIHDTWSTERIEQLSKTEILNLRDNARARDEKVIEQRCDAVLAVSFKSKRGVPRNSSQTSILRISDGLVYDVANLIVALPPAADVPLAQLRISSLSNPIRTFSELWRQFIVCGFSSLEKSDPGTPLANFASSDSAVLDLAAVVEHGGDLAWIRDELSRAGLYRMANKKRKLICSARAVFVATKGINDELVNGKGDISGLSIFLELARGRVNDHDLALSEKFSAAIDPTPFYGISHKQIRNILVNSGLAHNVVPIDSRWRTFLGRSLDFTMADLAQRKRYLAIENLLRQALLHVQCSRSDIPNLAVLDSMVFASQSSQGYGIDGWAGS